MAGAVRTRRERAGPCKTARPRERDQPLAGAERGTSSSETREPSAGGNTRLLATSQAELDLYISPANGVGRPTNRVRVGGTKSERS